VPYFAVSTNLSRYALHCHRQGSLWSAVRATGSIPALLPPFYTDDGEMLVDGALMDNVPVRVMQTLKQGPNVVIAFRVPQLERFAVDYHSLPSRGALLRRTLVPFSGEPLPDAPSPGTVLQRSLMANQQGFDRFLSPDDVLLVPPLPSDMSILDWGRHSALMQAAHTWSAAEIAALGTTGRHTLANAGPAGGIVRARPLIERN